MQIQYNITRIEEWCKSHNMPEGTLQLEHLMQATKLLQLKKVSVDINGYISFTHEISQATADDIEIIYDVCWMLSPSQIQRMCTNYFVADYEVIMLSSLQDGRSSHSTESYIPGNLTNSGITCCAQRPERSSFTRPRNRGSRTLRSPVTKRGLRIGDVCSCIP